MTRKLFFERMKEKRGEVPTTFSYDQLPELVRTQIRLIVEESNLNEENYQAIASILRETLGKRRLADGWVSDQFGGKRHKCEKEVLNFFANETDVEIALSVLELIGASLVRSYDGEPFIERVNERLRRAGIGWTISGNQLLQIEDELFFENVTAPCLSVLAHAGYKNAYRHFEDAYSQ